MRYAVTYVDRWVPAAIRGVQKKDFRKAMGFLRSMFCPTCKQFTRQDPVTKQIRICLPCGTQFTKRDARHAYHAS
jgi:hypothetical protein